MSNRPNKKPSSAQRVRDTRDQADRTSRTIWIFAAVGLAVLVIAIVAIVIARPQGADVSGSRPSPSGGTVVPDGDLEYGNVEVQGENLPPRPASGADPAVGMAVPTIDGQTFNGSALDITPDGRPKVAMVLAHWCPHCQAEVPRLQEWLDENGMPSDVDLVAVSTAADSSRPNYSPGRWLRREGWSVPTMVDDEQGTAALALGSSGFPFFVSIDAAGNVVTRASGEITIATWEGLLNAARSGGQTNVGS